MVKRALAKQDSAQRRARSSRAARVTLLIGATVLSFAAVSIAYLSFDQKNRNRFQNIDFSLV